MEVLSPLQCFGRRCENAGLLILPWTSRAGMLLQPGALVVLQGDPFPKHGDTASKSLPGAGKLLWLPQYCFIQEVFGSTCCPRGEVLQDTSPVLGKVSPGLLGALVLAWWQRVEAGDGPGHVSGTIGFTASTFLKTSAGTELQ